jgi:hypothetical protein
MIERLWNLVQEEDGFLVKLRCKNEFDEKMYSEIKEITEKLVEEWKKQESIPKKGFLILIELIEFLSRGSNFLSEKDAIRVEDAELEIKDIINDLYSTL